MYEILNRTISQRRPGLFAAQTWYRERLEIASALSEAGLREEAAGVLTEDVILAAAQDDGDRLIVARVFHDAGRLPEFRRRLGSGKPGVAYSAYAEAFHALKRDETALALLESKGRLEAADYGVYVAARKALGTAGELSVDKLADCDRQAFAKALMDAGEDRKALDCAINNRQGRLGREDYALGLRLCLRLGDFGTAARLFEEFSDTFALMEAPDLYYYFALLSQKSGHLEQARELYRKMLKRMPGYKDVADRLESIESLSKKDSTRLSTLAAGAERGKAPFAGPGGPLPGAPPAAGQAQLISGRYELRGCLGLGGMGVVYRGWDRQLSRDVAIKRIKDDVALDERARKFLLEEARLAATFNHPYAVAIHDIVVEGQETYLVFEFVDGETLSEILLSRKRLEPRECGRVLRFVCEALALAHRRGIIHRDVKPSNIMMDKNGYVKVMDFGLARQQGHRPATTTFAPHAGTPPYMSPEQHDGLPTPQSDVFALGVTAYELLSGNLPFPGPDFLAQKQRRHYEPLPELAPAPLREVIADCLTPKPAGRPMMADVGKRIAAMRL